MKIVIILSAIALFLIGFLSAVVVTDLYGIELGLGFNSGLSVFESVDGNVTPFDSIPDKDILVYPDRVVIKVKGASIGNYAPTGSMRPVLDKGTSGIRIIPKSEDEIFIGDIITYKKGERLIIHRVVEKSFDKEGVYFITKGDNNTISDGKIRFEDIEYKTIGLIY